MMSELVISAEFAAADAAYNAWRQEVCIPREPLQRQEPNVQARWLKIAAAACGTPQIEGAGAAP